MIQVVRTKDHPEANGRAPCCGEQAWTLTFPLEDGSTLRVLIGLTGKRALIDMLRQEEIDDRGGTYKVPGVTSDAD